LTDVAQSKPFYLTPSPFRAPAIVLWFGAMVIGLATPLISYFLGMAVISYESMLAPLFGFMLVAACASIVGNNLRNARTLLWGSAGAMLALSTWMAYDAIQTRYAQARTDSRLAADLNTLCREDGGSNLSDPACARYSRVFYGYHYPDGNVPPIP
jgi:hypothetical protein